MRVKKLEGELDGARETIARLKGERAEVDRKEEKVGWFSGVARHQQFEHELSHELTEDGYEAIADLLRNRLGDGGLMTKVGRNMTYRSPDGGRTVMVERGEGGRTRLRMSADFLATTVLMFMGIFGVAGVAMMLVAPALQALGFSPLSLLVAVPVVVIACWAALRPLVSKRVLKSRMTGAGVFESLVEVAEQHKKQPGLPPARVRVASEAGEGETEAATEAEAEQEAEALLAKEEETEAAKATRT